MKTAFALLLGVALGVLALALLQRGKAAVAPAGKDIDSVLNAWESQKLAREKRRVTFVLDDGRSIGDPLALRRETSDLERMQAKAGLLLGLRGPAGPGALSEALLQEPDTVFRSFEDIFAKREDDFVRALANDILRARRAGAEIDIVAQGRAGEGALKAVKLLEGAGPEAGVPIRSLVTIGMGEKRLRKADPVFFSDFKRPANLQGWTNLWNERHEGLPKVAATFYTPEGAGAGFLEGGLLSNASYKALTLGADESSFDRAVKELGAALSRFTARGGMSLGDVKPAPGMEPGFSGLGKSPSTKGLEPPRRVFRNIYGGMPGDSRSPAQVSAKGYGGRGAYRAEATEVRETGGPQPKPAAAPIETDEFQEISPQRAKKAKPVLPPGGDHLISELLSCCKEGSNCALPKPTRVLGDLLWYGDRQGRLPQKLRIYKLCESRRGDDCFVVRAPCSVRDGDARLVADLSGMCETPVYDEDFWHKGDIDQLKKIPLLDVEDCGNLTSLRP